MLSANKNKSAHYFNIRQSETFPSFAYYKKK